MKTILDIITPIKLLKGTHRDTAKTGQGCAMNVIAYLNGEDQITDQSTCVCITVRQPLVWLNDFLEDHERQVLIPFMLRAMGSATSDQSVINQRLVHVVMLANSMAEIAKRVSSNTGLRSSSSYIFAVARAASSAERAAKAAELAALATDAACEARADALAGAATGAACEAAAAATLAAIEATRVASRSATYASDFAACAAIYAAARASTYAEIKATAFAFLDAALPEPETQDAIVFERAKKLAETFGAGL